MFLHVRFQKNLILFVFKFHGITRHNGRHEISDIRSLAATWHCTDGEVVWISWVPVKQTYWCFIETDSYESHESTLLGQMGLWHENQEDVSQQWNKSPLGLPWKSKVKGQLYIYILYFFFRFVGIFHIHRLHVFPICCQLNILSWPISGHVFGAGKCNVAYWCFHTELKLMGCAAEPSVADCLRALQLAAEEWREQRYLLNDICGTFVN